MEKSRINLKRQMVHILKIILGVLVCNSSVYAVNQQLISIPDNTWVKLEPNPSQRYIPRNAMPSDVLEDQPYPITRSYSGIYYGDGKIFYFGGGHGSYPGNDVEIYDIENNVWIQSYKPEVCDMDDNSCNGIYGGWGTSAITPLGRPYTEHTYQQLAYDPVAKKLMALLASGTWEFDPGSKQWIYRAGLHDPNNPFSPLSNTSHVHLIYDENLGTILTILTATNRGIYTFKGGQWEKKSGTVPSDDWVTLYSAYVPDLGIHIIKGWGKFWKYNAVKQTWTEITSIPSGALHITNFDYDIHNKVLLGLNYTKGGIIEVWVYNIATETWTKMPTPDKLPPAGIGGSDSFTAANPLFRYAPSHNAFFYLYVPDVGGSYSGGEYSELWAYRYKGGNPPDNTGPRAPEGLCIVK